MAKRESRAFRITRGTKQGDPVSPPLFNAVLEKAMTKIKAKWLQKGWGIRVGPYPGDLLQNLRFADDVLLVAKSIKVLKQMLADLSVAAGEVGLELHMGKTNYLFIFITDVLYCCSAPLPGQPRPERRPRRFLICL